MSTIYSLQIKSVYNFEMKAGPILGYAYRNATVMGILDYQSANAIEDVTPIHNQVYSQLGAGVPKSAKDLIYVKIKTSTGEVRVLAMDWIAAEPELVTSQTVKATIRDMNLSDIERLRQVLLANGFQNVDIEVVV